MASLRVHPDRLEIHLTPAEKTLAFRRENLVISRDTIRSVTITDDPWIWVRGIRAPGALVPLVLAIGVWKFHGGRDFLAIKRRRQAVVIDLTGDDFARVVLSTNHAPDLIASLKLDPTEAVDVSDLDAPAATTRAVAPAKPAKRVRAANPVKPAPPVAPADLADETTVVKPAPVTRTRAPRAGKPAGVASVAEPAGTPAAEPGGTEPAGTEPGGTAPAGTEPGGTAPAASVAPAAGAESAPKPKRVRTPKPVPPTETDKPTD
jgi:hypothetical protein